MNNLSNAYTDDPVIQESKVRLYQALRKKQAMMGMESLYYFGKYILGYEKMEPQPHQALCDFVTNPAHQHQLILEPRGSFKTSVVTIGYTIWRIIKDPNIRVLLDSEDLNMTKTFLREIKAHFETNEELIKCYGNFVGEKWTESEIIVGKRTKKTLKEPTIATSGVETTRVGQHYDLILRDDLHSQQNTSSIEQIDKVKTHVSLSFSILEPSGQDITIGTRWHFADTYSDMIEKEELRIKVGLPKRLHIRISKAIYDDGALHFPSRLTKEFLENIKLEQGSYVYSCQYMNEPVDQESAKFKKEWFRYYGNQYPKNLFITSILDPAISEKDSACYTSITTIGWDCDGYGYLLDVYRDRVNPKVVIDKIFETHNKWHPNRFGIEVVAYQKTLKYWAKERALELGIFPYIVELRTDTRVTKAMRIEAAIPYVESGLIWFPGYDRNTVPEWCEPLVKEMEQFPVGKYIDCLDSFAYHFQIRGFPGMKTSQRASENTLDAIHKRTIRRNRGRSKSGIPILGHDNVIGNVPVTMELRH